MEFGIVELSRLQFAMTAMYHFLFVPLTLGLSILVAIMETVYVMTNRPIWRQMTKFWGTLFGINFVLGVATGITMEFQFGMNWSQYSRFVGAVFGALSGVVPGTQIGTLHLPLNADPYTLSMLGGVSLTLPPRPTSPVAPLSDHCARCLPRLAATGSDVLGQVLVIKAGTQA